MVRILPLFLALACALFLAANILLFLALALRIFSALSFASLFLRIVRDILQALWIS